MRNDNYKTALRSYDADKSNVISCVNIDCKEYETFKKLVEAVTPILKEEDKPSIKVVNIRNEK